MFVPADPRPDRSRIAAGALTTLCAVALLHSLTLSPAGFFRHAVHLIYSRMEEQSSPNVPLVTGLQVVAIYVTDLDRARRFYADLLGFEDRGELSPGRLLKSGDLTLYLEGGRKPGSPAGMELPTTSLCFDSASIRRAYETLRAAEVPVVEEYREHSPEFAMFRVADPDGNVVEFAGHP